MQTQFALDLCTARKKAGLTPRDLSILLELGSEEVAALEEGAAPPSLDELCRLAIIYNRSFAEHYQHVMHKAREALFRNLPDLPECVDGDTKTNRDATLHRLERDLVAALTRKDGRA